MRLSAVAKQEIRDAVNLYRDLLAERRELAQRIKQTKANADRLRAMHQAEERALVEMGKPFAGASEASKERAREAAAEAGQRAAEVQAEVGKLAQREAALLKHEQAAHRVASSLMNEVDLAEALLREELDWPSDGAQPPRRMTAEVA